VFVIPYKEWRKKYKEEADGKKVAQTAAVAAVPRFKIRSLLSRREKEL
jgi:hypothetical protein